jgi:MFS family permease
MEPEQPVKQSPDSGPPPDTGSRETRAILKKDRMLPRFSLYGFLKNLRFFDPFIILIFREAGLSFLQIGILYAVRDISANLLEIPTGVFADAFGRRRSMLMAFGSYIVSFGIFYTGHSFMIYALAMVLFAFGEAFRSGTHKALILEHLTIHKIENLKVEYYGRTRSFSQLGSAVNALIAAALVFFAGGYRAMFLAATVPYILDFINLAGYPKALDGDLAQRSQTTIKSQIRTTLQDFLDMLTDTQALRAILNSSGISGLFKSSKDYLQPILESWALTLPVFLLLVDERRSALVIGLVYFVIYLVTTYASRSAAQFSHHFHSLERAINLTFAAGAGLLLLAGLAVWQGVTWAGILSFLLFYALYNVRRPMNVSFISDQISHRVMASGLSVEAQFTSILAALFAPILGALTDQLGIGPALVILAAFVLTLLIWVRVGETPASIQEA